MIRVIGVTMIRVIRVIRMIRVVSMIRVIRVLRVGVQLYLQRMVKSTEKTRGGCVCHLVWDVRAGSACGWRNEENKERARE